MKKLSVLVTLLLFISVSLSAQMHSDTTKSMHKMMHSDSTKHMMHNMGKTDSSRHMQHNMDNMHKMDSSKMNHMNHDKMGMKKSPLVREGVIDLKAIDKNKDGKVFQDFMDWNVISDKAGNCPVCGMKLREVSLEKAAANLEKHGYKVKK